MITFGRLISRDLFDQLSQILSEDVPKSAYGAIITNGGNVPFDSVYATYVRLDRMWIFSAFKRLEQDVDVAGFYMVWTWNKIPIFGVSILMDAPVRVKAGRYEVRLEYVLSPSRLIGTDVVCTTRRDYTRYDILCAI